MIARSNENDFTLDIDATMIETKKHCADMTYLGCRAFQALLSFSAELDLCVACDYRQGSGPAGTDVKQQLRAAVRLLESCGTRLAYLRSDSAGCTEGKAVRHGRWLILRVCESRFELLRDARQRLTVLAAPG